MKWSPKPYQFDAVKFLLQNCNAGIFLDPGMGKTSVTLATVAHLRATGHVGRVLIVAPIRPMYKVWPDEIKKWDEFKHLSYTILHGDRKDEALNKISDIYLINPEGLKWFNDKNGWSKLAPDMLVIDESTKFKDYSTARFKLLKPQLRHFKRRIILTGEPAPNGYMDLFGQMYVVDRGGTLGQYITHYRAQYFFPSGYGGYDWKLRQGADKEIQDKIRPHVMRLAAEDHLEMPELVINDVLVELDSKTMDLYKQFEDEFLAEVGDKVIMSVNAAASGVKCRQVANGSVYDELHIAHKVHEHKLSALYDLVEQLQGNPILVGYEFQFDLENLRKIFPKAPSMTGLDGKKLDLVIDGFNRGDIPVLLTQFQSGSHGLNLQAACHHVACFGLPWDLDVYHQFYKRVWRQGQPNNRVFLHRFIADRTLDKQVAKALFGKELTQSAFLKAITRREE